MTPEKDFSSRYSLAKRWRDGVRQNIEDVLKFCANGRQNDFSTRPGNPTQPDNETFISIGEEMATDLAGDLVNFYTPPEARWAEYEILADVPKELEKQVLALVQAREDELFSLIESSNYNDVAPQITFEAATHGTTAIWCDKGHLQEPIFIDIVPPNELLLTPGHMGYLDRFRETWVMAHTLPALLGDEADLSAPELRKKMAKPTERAKVTWGFWLNWDEPGNPRWMRQITVDDKAVTPAEDIGPISGACPLLVGRFNPQPRKPWGRGPAIKALPDLFVLNKIEEVILNKLDEALDPPWSYVDDGIMDMQHGFQSGMAYPRRAGSEPPQPLPNQSQLDYGFYSKEEMEQRIRVAFYQDGPRQRGETPPTASQWLDERRRVQQRLGKPSAPLWTELYYPFIQRVEYIAVQNGLMEQAITLNGNAINVRPISPLQKSQNQDQVMISRGNLDLAFAVYQDRVEEFIDPVGTFQNIVRASGDTLTVIREEQQQAPNEAPPA